MRVSKRSRWGRRATKGTLSAQSPTVTWDLGILQSSCQLPICLATTYSSSLLCSWPVTSLAAPRRLPSAPDHRAVCSSGPPGRTEAEREEAVTRTRPAPSLETAGVSGAQIRRLRLLKRRSRHLSVSTQVAHLRLIVCSASQAGSMSLCGQATLSPPLSLQPPPSCPFSPLCSSPVL